jgi:hypothetical protein
MAASDRLIDIFISYKSTDRTRIWPLARALRAQKWDVWWDRDLLAGDSWDKTIEAALTKARCVIVAWSSLSVESDWVKEEARLASGLGKLIPILLDYVTPPFGFGGFQAEDLSEWLGNPDEAAFQRLCAAIHTKLGASPNACPPRLPRLTEEERLLAAYRESGRCIVTLNVKAADPLHEATILPGRSTSNEARPLSEPSTQAMSLEQMMSRLAITMARRAAEELVFGLDRLTSASAPDIEKATELAQLMVMRWGFSRKVGIIAYPTTGERKLSEATTRKIDTEVQRLVESGYAEAMSILTEKREELEPLARALLEFDALSGDEVKDLLAGKRPMRPSRDGSVD